MKYEIKNRFSGAVQFTAEIENNENTGVKTGLAVKWAVTNEANLSGANLSGANLSEANLSEANLSEANLSEADLSEADMYGADLRRAMGNMAEIKSLQLEEYTIAYTAEHIQIGCQKHTIEEWRKMTQKQILAMDGKKALTWWKKWKPVLFQIIEMSPATPTEKGE